MGEGEEARCCCREVEGFLRENFKGQEIVRVEDCEGRNLVWGYIDFDVAGLDFGTANPRLAILES